MASFHPPHDLLEWVLEPQKRDVSSPCENLYGLHDAPQRSLESWTPEGSRWAPQCENDGGYLQSPVKAEAINPTSCHILLWTNFSDRERHLFCSRVETLVNVLRSRWSLKRSYGLFSRVPAAPFRHLGPPISETASRGYAGTIGFEKAFCESTDSRVLLYPHPT